MSLSLGRTSKVFRSSSSGLDKSGTRLIDENLGMELGIESPKLLRKREFNGDNINVSDGIMSRNDRSRSG